MEMDIREIQKEAKKDPRVRKAFRKFLAILILSWLVGVNVTFNFFQAPIYSGIFSILLTSICLFFLYKFLKIKRFVSGEISQKVLFAEKARLLKIKESMTPGEWEAYLVQIENNKILKDLKKQRSKTTTTTTYGFFEEI